VTLTGNLGSRASYISRLFSPDTSLLTIGDSVLQPIFDAGTLQALLSRVHAQANRFSDTVALFQALGGGWWNREDRDPPKHYPFFNLTD
jgi:outer membrane protein TolC